MRILIDESLPVELSGELDLPDVKTVSQLGWQGLKNGALLQRATASGFTILITADRNLEHQQNIPLTGVAVIVLRARSNRMQHLRPLIPVIVQALSVITPGQLLRLGA